MTLLAYGYVLAAGVIGCDTWHTRSAGYGIRKRLVTSAIAGLLWPLMLGLKRALG